MRRIPALDGIRGLAILLVICCHYVALQLPAPHLPPHTLPGFLLGLSGSTWSGVELFFVLSGYLIGGILLDNREANNFLKVFYIRRICRIFPLYFSWLLLCVAICKTPLSIKLHFFPPIFPSNTEFGPYFFYLQNLVGQMAHGKMPMCLAVTWSLAVEEQFYCVMPVLILLLPRKTLAILMGLVVVSCPFIRMYFPLPFWRWDGLSLGVLLALAQRNPQIWNALKEGRGGIRFLWILTMLAAWVAPLYGFVPNGCAISLHDISWTFLVLLTITGDGLLTWVTTRSLLVKAGAISYGLYLLHLPMLHFVFWWENGVGLIDFFDWVLTALAFVLVWVVAQVSYEYFESPIVARGHRVRYLEAASP